MSDTTRAQMFSRLFAAMTEDVVRDYEQMRLEEAPWRGWPEPDELLRFAYVYTTEPDEWPSVDPFLTLKGAQSSAREDVYSDTSRWPVAILDLDEGTYMSVSVGVIFDEPTPARDCECGCGKPDYFCEVAR